MSIRQRATFKDIESLRVGRYGNKVNTSCIVYRLGDTIIDTGPSNMWRTVRRFIQERAVEKVLLTHHHEDHSGNLSRIKKVWNPEIFSHEACHRAITHSFKVPLYRQLVWGRPRLKVETSSLPELFPISNQFHLKPIHSPGHSKDMTCYLEPNRGWLFTGDLYVAAHPKYSRKVEDPNLEIESLRHILTLDFETVLCSHRGVLENGREAISKKLNYLLALREQVKHYRKVGDSIQEICKRFLGTEGFLHYFSLGEYSKSNYIRAFANYIPKPEPTIEFIETMDSENSHAY